MSEQPLDPAPCISNHPEGSVIEIYAQPRASRTRIIGLHDNMLKIGLAAPPVDGKANRALLKWLARALKLPASRLSLIAGDSGRRKRLLVMDIEPAELANRILPDLRHG